MAIQLERGTKSSFWSLCICLILLNGLDVRVQAVPAFGPWPIYEDFETTNTSILLFGGVVDRPCSSLSTNVAYLNESTTRTLITQNFDGTGAIQFSFDAYAAPNPSIPCTANVSSNSGLQVTRYPSSSTQTVSTGALNWFSFTDNTHTDPYEGTEYGLYQPTHALDTPIAIDNVALGCLWCACDSENGESFSVSEVNFNTSKFSLNLGTTSPSSYLLSCPAPSSSTLAASMTQRVSCVAAACGLPVTSCPGNRSITSDPTTFPINSTGFLEFTMNIPESSCDQATVTAVGTGPAPATVASQIDRSHPIAWINEINTDSYFGDWTATSLRGQMMYNGASITSNNLDCIDNKPFTYFNTSIPK